MEAESRVYEMEGLERYLDYQVEHEEKPLLPGDAFPFVKALMSVNVRLREIYPDSEELFDIVLMTSSYSQVGVRFINSISHYNLAIERICMTGGQNIIDYLKAYNTNLYLSKDPEKVTEAIKEGIAAATVVCHNTDFDLSDTQLRVAFDGDALLLDDSEITPRQAGLHKNESENMPLAQSPLMGFLDALGKLQKRFYAKDEREVCPIRTFLVTGCSASSSGKRVLKTLQNWGVQIDLALFTGGAPKGVLLQNIKPHIYFDDQMFHIRGAKVPETFTTLGLDRLQIEDWGTSLSSQRRRSDLSLGNVNAQGLRGS